MKIIEAFLDRDSEIFSVPFFEETKIGRYLCSTDGYSAVMIPVNAKIKITEEGFKIKTILPLPSYFEDLFTVDFEKLKKLFEESPNIYIKKEEECPSCEGSGEFLRLGFSYHCKNCEGSGKIKKDETEKVKDKRTIFKFNDCFIRLSEVEKIIYINTILEKNKIDFKIVKIEKTKNIIWFKIDKIYLAISTYEEESIKENNKKIIVVF